MAHATLMQIFDRAVARARPDLLRYKAEGVYRSISSEEFAGRVRTLSGFLRTAGVGSGDRVALVSENRPEWTISDLAILSARGVTVPIYTTLSPEQAGYILRDAGCRVALVSSRALLERIALAARTAPSLDHVVLFDRVSEMPRFAAADADEVRAEGSLTDTAIDIVLSGPRRIRVTFLDGAYRAGGLADANEPDAFDAVRGSIRPEDLATIIYTSGTTGDPKGAMLTHSNFCSNVDAALAIIPFDDQDVALSFLPLSHVFERMVEYAYLAAGGAIAFAESFDTVATNLVEVRPTVVSSVPRFFEKIHARILENARAGSWPKRKIFEWAVRVGKRRLPYSLQGRRTPAFLALQVRLAERLVFSKVQARLGGRLRFFISGGAPLGREVCEFFLGAGIIVLEGYGLTETSPTIAVNTLDGIRPGTVGRVIPGVEVRIAEDGEILVRGPNVMKGYFGKPEETARVTRDGWFATGDIGRLDEDGFLTITDRKKDLLITSGGKNVAPQPIENAIKSSRYVANAVLIGDRRKFISALVVPDFEALRTFAARQGLGDVPPSELLRRPEIVSLFESEIAAATAGFAAYERVKKFTLLERDFTVEAGEMTPTLKVKRRVIVERYRPQIEALYSST